MDAGRELDALIAEKVFGVSHCRGFDPSWGKSTSGQVVYPEELPHYSTDIAVAWGVVEKMATLNWVGSVSWSRPSSYDNQRATVGFSGGESGQDYFDVSATSVPLAICQAALRVFGLFVAEGET